MNSLRWLPVLPTPGLKRPIVNFDINLKQIEQIFKRVSPLKYLSANFIWKTFGIVRRIFNTIEKIIYNWQVFLIAGALIHPWRIFHSIMAVAIATYNCTFVPVAFSKIEWFKSIYFFTNGLLLRFAWVAWNKENRKALQLFW